MQIDDMFHLHLLFFYSPHSYSHPCNSLTSLKIVTEKFDTVSAHTIFYMTWFLFLQSVEISIKSLESAPVKSKKHALFKSSCHPLKRSLYVQCFTAPCPGTIVPQFRLFVPNEHHSKTWP